MLGSIGVDHDLPDVDASLRRHKDLTATLTAQDEHIGAESGQFLAWIGEMMSGAKSEDTGQDYEHLEILLARFQEFKLRVQAGEDKFNTCENLAKRLESVEKNVGTVDVKEVQAKLTNEWMPLIEAIQEKDKKAKICQRNS